MSAWFCWWRRCAQTAITRLAELGDVSWRRYRQAGDARLLELETAVGQYAHLLADLMTVDGPLVVRF